MTSFNRETLIRVRGRLHACLDLMHDEANASAREELIHAIATLDNYLESNGQSARAEVVYELIGKIIEKLPWIVSVMKVLD